MNPISQLSTRKYEQRVKLVKKVMDELEITCKIKNAYELSEPFAKAGWMFFNIYLSSDMFSIIEKSGMMKGALGFRITFMHHRLVLILELFAIVVLQSFLPVLNKISKKPIKLSVKD